MLYRQSSLRNSIEIIALMYSRSICRVTDFETESSSPIASFTVFEGAHIDNDHIFYANYGAYVRINSPETFKVLFILKYVLFGICFVF